MTKFAIGQEVVYIKRSIPESGLVKGKVYTIQDMQRCGCSNNIDVGVAHNFSSVRCPDCCESICYDQRWFINEEAFVPVESGIEVLKEEFELTEVI